MNIKNFISEIHKFSGWLSDPPDFSLTFAEEPRSVRSCFNELIVSEQGFAIEEREFRSLKNAIRSRNRRDWFDGDLDGEVHVPQFASQLQARAMFADREMKRAFRAFSEITCEYLSSLMSRDLTHLNPTLLVRKLAKNPLVQARWATERVLEYWPCTYVHSYRLSPVPNVCFDKVAVNATLREGTKPINAFLDPITHILEPEAVRMPCIDMQFIALELDGELVKINQLTGEKHSVANVEEISILNKEWRGFLPETQLQIFHKLVLTKREGLHLQLIWRVLGHCFGTVSICGELSLDPS